MKNPLLIGITGITLVTLTATTLYAQTSADTSIIDRMKAAVHAFTLSADLNPGQTGLDSAPIKGKKTGDILTAGEWNRMLELLSENVAGVPQNIGAFKSVIFDGINCPNDNCVIKGQNGVSSVKRIQPGVYRVMWSSPMTNADYLTMAHSSQFTYSGDGDSACTVPPATKTVNDWAFCQVSGGMSLTASNSISVFAIDYGATSGGGSGSAWTDVPLTDTADFDVDCEYRVKMDAVGNLPGGNKDDWIYNPTRIGKKVINWENSIVIQSASKNVLWWQWSSNDTYANVTAAWGRHITKIEKRCN